MKRFFRAVGRVLKWIGIVLLVTIAVLVVVGWKAMGKKAEGARLERMERSAQWRDGVFVNPQPIINDNWGAISGLFGASPHVTPEGPVPTVTLDRAAVARPPASGLRVTWFGHASMLIEIDGVRVLTDPVWSERASPFGFLGPTRWYPPVVKVDDLPAIDAVVISHDHYDHLDYPTIVTLARRTRTKFVVPLGIGAHLEYWGVPARRVVDLDWWESTRVRGVELVCTPARHQTGRIPLFDDNTKLWGSWSMIGPRHRAFFSGDTGPFPAMRRIGEEYGPFDVTMIEVGQYHRAWPDWHIGPEQAVAAHEMLRGRVLLPIHWGLFTLAYHSWTEPVERVLAAAQRADVAVLTPRPGEGVEPTAAPTSERWWPELPWETAAEHPIRSSGL